MDNNSDNNNNSSNNNNNNNNNKNEGSKFPKHIFLPTFLNKDMPIGTFFVTAGVLSMVGFATGLLIGFRKTGGIKQTLRSAPPGVVMAASKALLGGTAICAGFTTGLVFFLKHQYNIKTVKDFGDMMRGKPSTPELTLIDEKTYLQQQQQQQESNNNTDLGEVDKETLEALRALKYIPFDFTNQDDKNNNTNDITQNHDIVDIGINDNNSDKK
ncbi:hypothetical protein DICPUDRAFT_78592 [Dictyostelium purpureum]|uniref:Transmembrane protein 242 n=1 Tax=Dictyostelium purpureum TaxID=5786 RepID=F0ZK04_DICPU|nr:uncharacterized protein DICPUDRAFT_78592 [Dictyostelium purpureum]EGC35747.1 hypothetical protein DICPUDRAFT_78592 [Dictyostelium purpureum]|eukprot:XP_003287750.1 hypothetical protein DICPUDRAFT_78592 [Dictyostelium purpureum]